MFDWVPGESINCIYFAMVAIGLMYTVISLIGADFGADVEVGGPDLDFHLGPIDIGGVEVPEMSLGVDAPQLPAGGGLHLPSISPFTIASFVTGFGGAGLISTLAFEVSAITSLLWGMLGGVVMGGVVQVFFGAVLLKSQGSSDVRLSRLTGTLAEVTLPIEPGGSGRIALVAEGRRMTFGARLIGSESVPRGAQVEIIRVVGGTAVVRPVDVER